MHNYNFDNNYSLLEFAAFIYVFYNKNRFINFGKITKGQKILNDINTIIVESWEKISLP